MAKRPSYRSIRLRQRNIVEGIRTADITRTEASKRFGVTTAELNKFLDQKPQTLHQNYNRSPSYKVLVEQGARSEVRKDLGVKRIRRLNYSERNPKDDETKRAIRAIRFYYVDNGYDAIEWASLTAKVGVPTSIDAIKVLYRNDRITKSQYGRLVRAWKRIYGVGDDYAARYEDLIEDEEDYDE